MKGKLEKKASNGQNGDPTELSVHEMMDAKYAGIDNSLAKLNKKMTDGNLDVGERGETLIHSKHGKNYFFFQVPIVSRP